MNDCVLKVDHLKKYYGKQLGIEDVSFELHKGEIYGFIGPNGAGKSTTIRTIMGLLHQDFGSVLFHNQAFSYDDIEMKQKIGYLPSEIHLYEDMKVGEMFDYHEKFFDDNIHSNRVELVKTFQINESKKIGELSFGNLKKVGIVLALMHGPDLLILDEASNGLDPIMQKRLHEILLKEKEKGTTILYSSHVLSEVSNLCDKIGFIKDGVIIKEDSIHNIKKNNYTYLTISSKDINKIKKDLSLTIKDENDSYVKFINHLDANTLLKKLSKYSIDQLLIEEISLEDLFENYYM